MEKRTRALKFLTISKILSTLQTFISQIAIFYAQWTYMRSWSTFLDDDEKEYFEPVSNGPTLIWLRIETVGYYSYILAISAYIIWH